MSKNVKEQIYYVRGMHCASCEILIEKKLLELEGVKSVEASMTKGKALIEYEGEKPTTEKLNGIFQKEGYLFFDRPADKTRSSGQNKTKARQTPELFAVFGIGLLIIIGFIGLNKLGLAGLINVGLKSSLPMFFAFGLLAGISSCAALVGGIILSMSKQWSGLYSKTDSGWKKIQPQLIFNAGRLVSYGALGAALGAIGGRFNFSLKFGPILVVAVSVMMIFLAFQMFGFKAFRKFQLTAPRFITRFVANESNFKGRYAPFLMGALTFFLPCGFTITAQGLALISGSAVQGGLIMFLFALGTLPMLLVIGLSSVKFLQKPHLAEKFLKIAGILVLFFALYNINFQLNVLGVASLSDLGIVSNAAKNNSAQNEAGLPPIINGKQILKMDASSSGYSPNYFKVRVGTPVRWEITDKGTSGCTNAVISKNLFEGEISLTPGQTSIKEFTPKKIGKYKFSCWMGMVSGIIEVVGENGSAVQNGISDPSAKQIDSNNLFAPSGAENLGGSCGINGGCRCGGR